MYERITAIIAAVGGICWLAACIYSLTLPDLESPLRDVFLVPLGVLLLVLAGGGLAVCILMRCYDNRETVILSGRAFFSVLAGVVLLEGGVFTMVDGFAQSEIAKGSRFFAVGFMAVGLTFMTAVTIRLRVGLSWVVVPLWIGTAFLLAVDEQAAILFAFGLAWVAVGVILWRMRDVSPRQADLA